MSSDFPLSSPIEIGGTPLNPGEVNFSDGTNSVQVKAPTSLTGTVNFTLPDSNGTSGQVLKWPSSGDTLIWGDEGGTGGNTNLWFISDIKPSGTDGGTFTAGAWQTRDLNTLNKPSGVGTEIQIGVAPASANQLRIEDGLYRITVRAPAFGVLSHITRLQNITDGTTELLGTVRESQPAIFTAAASTSISTIDDTFVVSSGPKVYEIQHQCGTTNATDGYGVAAGFGVDEIYTQLSLEKLN